MRTVLALLLTAALVAPTASLAGGKGKKTHNEPSAQTHASEAIAVRITVTERTIISDYVSQYREALVPAKPLPPGIAKKVARGGTLPPGIAKRYLPQDLLVQLPPRPGYQWAVVDDDIVLIAAATGLIVDILADIL